MPINIRSKIRVVELPYMTQKGVDIVKIAVDKIPKPRVCLPPNFSAIMPPGKFVRM